MDIASHHQHSLVVQHDRLADFIEQRYAGWHAAVPVLMGLSIVCIAAATVLLSLAPSLALVVNVVMAALMLGAAILSVVSMLATGQVIEAKFDYQRQVLRLLYRGPTAHSQWHVPFRRLSNARMAMTYSENGDKELTPMLELTDGSKIRLPDATTWHDIEEIRTIIASFAPEPTLEAWSKKENARANNRHLRRTGRN